MRKLNLVQGSPEWLEYRRTHIGSSDAAAILGLSSWKTPFQLWKEKIEGIDQLQNSAMKRGKELEPIARAKFNEQFEMNMKADNCVFESLERDWQIASLDGYDEFHNAFIEIKCGSQKLHEEADFDIIPDDYKVQIQHQMSVTGIDKAYYCSYYPNSIQPLRVIVVERDEELIQKIIEKELEFLECLRTVTPPALTEKDYDLIEDPRGSELLKEYVELGKKEKELQKKRDSIKDEITALNNEKNFILDGVKIYQTSRVSYDHEKMRSDGIRLEQYKKVSAPYWMISAKRESSKSL